MKKSVLLSIIGVLLVVGVGITFAYFTSGVEVSGEGSSVKLDPGDMIKVTYDAGDNSLSSNNLIPGQTLTKTFTVTVTPTSKENTASYSIYLDLTNNTFVKCDDSNYNSITNACIKDYEELTYTFKDNTGAILSSGNLIGESGRMLLAAETKTVDSETTYEYTIEITFHETNADQNHNMDKVLNGSIEVEFGMVGSDYILSHYDTILTRDDFSTTVTETTTGTIYKSLDESQYDDFGEVYYFAGNPTDNWVHFGGYYWRIIRINGNGSIRLIYSGSDTTGPITSGIGTLINNGAGIAFNSSFDHNRFVGYMYGSSTGNYNQIHDNLYNSTIKDLNDNWYETNLINYLDKLDIEVGFCGDRSLSTGTGLAQTYTEYGAYERLVTSKEPAYKCDKHDLYTVRDNSQNIGNKALEYPIGLISVDEMAFAGGMNGANNLNYYLHNGVYYWTMSPYSGGSGGTASTVFYINDGGNLVNGVVDATDGVRPVINIRSDVQITGSGTTDDPFVVVGAE